MASTCAPRRPSDREDALRALEEYRISIDALDLRLLALLNERTRIVEEIGRVKRSAKLPIYEPRREDQVFANVTRITPVR